VNSEGKPLKKSRSASPSKTIDQSKRATDALKTNQGLEPISRATAQASHLTANIPNLSGRIQRATKAIGATDTSKITASVNAETGTTLPSPKLPQIEMPKVSLPKALTAQAVSLPKHVTPTIGRTVTQRFYGGGDALFDANERDGLNPVMSSSDLGNLVRKAREDRKLSQQSFADLAGVGRRFVSELENGKATLELGKVLKVAHAAGISLFAMPR
jgi:HTH-type transcriptional regulator/antitoxin HipB